MNDQDQNIIARFFLLCTGIGMLFLAVTIGGCLKEFQKTPSDVTHQRNGYFRGGSYQNDVYRFHWEVAGWTPVKPGLTLGQRFIFGWDNPNGNVRSRLWIYERSASAQSRTMIPAQASLREAAAWIALRHGWAFLESAETVFNGQAALKGTYLRGAEEKGIVYVWLESDAVLMVNTFTHATDFDRFRPEIQNALSGFEFVHLQDVIAEPNVVQTPLPREEEIREQVGEESKEESPIRIFVHTIRYPGETLAFIAQWYTGSASNWTRIVEINHGISPRDLRLGQEIFIPMDIITKNDPMPQAFIRSSAQPAKLEDKTTEAGNTNAQQEKSGDSDAGGNASPPVLIMAPPR